MIDRPVLKVPPIVDLDLRSFDPESDQYLAPFEAITLVVLLQLVHCSVDWQNLQ